MKAVDPGNGTCNPAISFETRIESGAVHGNLSADSLLPEANPREEFQIVQQCAGVIADGEWMAEEKFSIG